MIKKEKIQNNLTTKKLGRNLELFAEIDESTNDYLKRKTDEGAQEGTAVIAGSQANGRGRMGRNWYSGKPGESLAISFFVTPDTDLKNLPCISLLAALSVYDTLCKNLNENEAEKIKIKWPNDILISNRKVCGILTELKSAGDNNVIVGIGINLSQEEFCDEIKSVATSLKLSGLPVPAFEEFIASLFNTFEKRLDRFLRDGFESQMCDYLKSLAGLNEEVKVLDANSKVVLEGVIKGITKDGELIIEKDDGVVKNISGGEISIRGGFYDRK